jgi:phosphohistidine phosphatase SixA
MPLYLVRHAKAGGRRDDASDEERPLTENGRRQADRIAEVLAGAGIERVLTSRYIRCVETVQPLADKLGLTPELHVDLAEEADVEAAWQLLEGLAGITAVLCSHGNIISPLLDRVLRRGADIDAAEWSCHKGSIWRLEPDATTGRFGRAVLDVVQA